VRFKSRRGRDDLPVVRVATPLLAKAALPLALALAVPASGEIYRCRGADGKDHFTSDASACPGAQRHQPSREVQRVGGGASAGEASGPAAPAPAAAKAPLSEDAQAAMWKRKRTEAESERDKLARSLVELEEVVTWCNRGGDLTLEDELGVRQEYDCADAQATYAKHKGRLSELRRYLASGLEEECRRAGCLPGWIR
jgi:hypothetical protein